jgi:hypothetical protein
MEMKKQLIATLAGFVVYFLLGFLFYGVLLMDFFSNNTGTATGVARTDNEMVWWALIGGNIMQSYLLVFIFSKWAKINTFAGGFSGGATLGFIMSLGFGLNIYGTSNISNLTATLVDPIVLAVMLGATGGVIGWVLGRK